MPNVFWYYCIMVIGIGLIIFTMYKKKNVIEYFSFFLSASALAYLCEVIILFVFSSYEYKPGLFSDPIAESIFGHLVCNGFYWGGFSLLVAAFSLRYYWILLISVLFTLTEVLFLKLGIYTHHWWRLYMTGLCTTVFLLFVKKWFSMVKEKKHEFVRYFTFYFTSWLLLLGPSVILLIAGKQHYGIGLVPNMYRDDILFDAPYHLILAFSYIFFVNFLKKFYWKFAPLIFIVLSDFILMKMNILRFQNGWNLFYLAQLRYLCLALYIVLEKHSLRFDT
ncbi:MAG TPA: hypothetical protein VF941_09770 [Clostridia bacterium]